MLQNGVCGLFHPFQDHIGNMRFAPDTGRVPDPLALLFRWIAPCRQPLLEPLLHDAPRFAEHHRDVFKGMQAVADKKWNHHNVP